MTDRYEEGRRNEGTKGRSFRRNEDVRASLKSTWRVYGPFFLRRVLDPLHHQLSLSFMLRSYRAAMIARGMFTSTNLRARIARALGSFKDELSLNIEFAAKVARCKRSFLSFSLSLSLYLPLYLTSRPSLDRRLAYLMHLRDKSIDSSLLLKLRLDCLLLNCSRGEGP